MCTNFAVSEVVALDAVVTVAADTLDSADAVISLTSVEFVVASAWEPIPNIIYAKATGEPTAVNSLAVVTKPY